jgi:UDP-N-acetylmuramoyl-L-alanyl-D-glutamate--2,6-diaminopimelate ligase
VTAARVSTFGIDNPSSVTAEDISYRTFGTAFTLTAVEKGSCPVSTRLIGRHNVYNILAAASWGIEAGFDLRVIREAVEKFSYVPGRLERIDCGQDFTVYVDYAHTEDALRNVISSLRQVAGGKIIVVFGCGGDRDKEKRPAMGETATRLADFAVITTDNPRSEDPVLITEAIRRGIGTHNYCVVLDRREAIKSSFALAKAGDIVLIAGKGHEDYQVIKDTCIHFDDREVARECLQSMS